MKDLESCVLSPEKEKIRDALLQQLQRNKAEFYARKNKELFTTPEEMESFLNIPWHEESARAGASIFGIDLESLLRISLEDFFYSSENKHYIKLQQESSEILTQLLALDVEARIGTDFIGHYPHIGIDVDLPYQVGGRWVAIEPFILPKKLTYEQVLEKETRFGKKFLEEKRLIIVRSNILRKASPKEKKLLEKKGETLNYVPIERADPILKKYPPDVVLIKVPAPWNTHYEVLRFYQDFVTKPTLIISDVSLEHKQLKPLKNIAGLSKVDRIGAIRDYGSNKPVYPLCLFFMYVLTPKNF